MHPLVDADRLQQFMRALGSDPLCSGRVYITGGGSAVLVGWRAQTADADLLLVPDSDPLLRAIQRLKQSLRMNVELASPAHFVPELPGWQDRSVFITREGRVDFFHYDFSAQALSKILRGQEKDLGDVAAMIERGLIEPEKVWDLFVRIEERLFRFPNINPQAFRAAVRRVLGLGPEDPPPPNG
jgi:hypothetical protein